MTEKTAGEMLADAIDAELIRDAQAFVAAESIPYGPTDEDRLCYMFNARFVEEGVWAGVSCRVYWTYAQNDMGVDCYWEAVIPDTFGYWEKYNAFKRSSRAARDKLCKSVLLFRKHKHKRKSTTIAVEKRGGQNNRGKCKRAKNAEVVVEITG